jgi:hypothetical protein
MNIFFRARGDGRMPPSQQAFSAARRKIRHGAFLELFGLSASVAASGASKSWIGLSLFAIDGSVLGLPAVGLLREAFGAAGAGATSPAARGSILYDVLNDYIVDATLDPMSTGEREQASRHLLALAAQPGRDPRKCVIIFDRGYASAQLISELEGLGLKYVMRVRKGFNVACDNAREGADGITMIGGRPVRIVKFSLEAANAGGEGKGKVSEQGTEPGTDKVPDADKNTGKNTGKNKNKGTDKKGGKETSKDMASENGQGQPDGQENGTVETLITNLMGNNLGTAAFKWLYHKRWPVETEYDIVKNKLETGNFTGWTVQAILQDFYACMYMANAAAVFARDAQAAADKSREDKDNRYQYKINTCNEVATLRDRFVDMLLTESEEGRAAALVVILALIARSVVQVRPERHVPRNLARSTKWHHNHKSST